MRPLSLVAFVAGLALVHANTLRGINPDLASLYSGVGGTFTCISGIPKTIPFTRVNDDYCDCPDGSDEPGKVIKVHLSLLCVSKLNSIYQSTVQALQLATTDGSSAGT